jgi:hypothetical protein
MESATMSKFTFSILVGTALVLTAGAANANGVAVPEIDGMAGLAAMGAIGAVMAYVWERPRKQR